MSAMVSSREGIGMMKIVMIALAFTLLAGCGPKGKPEDALLNYFDAVASGNPSTIYNLMASRHRSEKSEFVSSFMESGTTRLFREFLRDNTEREFIDVDIDGDYAVIYYREAVPNIVPALSELVDSGRTTGHGTDFDLLTEKLLSDGFETTIVSREVAMVLEGGEWKVIPTEHMYQ